MFRSSVHFHQRGSAAGSGFGFQGGARTASQLSSQQQVLYNALNTLGLIHHEKQQLQQQQKLHQKAQQQERHEHPNKPLLTTAMLKRAYLKKSLEVHPDTARHFKQQREASPTPTTASSSSNTIDTTKEFQELGEALSIAMKFVQDQNFANLRDSTSNSSSSSDSGPTLWSIQEGYLRNLKHLAEYTTTTATRAATTSTMTDDDHLRSLQQIVTSCSHTRKSFRHINNTSDSMAERLCGRRSFDVLNLFSPNLLIRKDDDHVDVKDGTQLEDCARAFNLFVTILPNIVARLRRISPTITTAITVSQSSSSSSSSSHSKNKSATPSLTVVTQEDSNAIQTAYKFGFQPCVLIGGMLIHDGDFCGLLSNDEPHDKLFKNLLVRQNYLLQQSSASFAEYQQSHQFTMSDLAGYGEDKLAQKLLKVHPELICCVGLRSLLLSSPSPSSDFSSSSSSSSSFQKRTTFLEKITPSLFQWQIRSARRLKTENRLLVSCRSLALEMGAVFPELSCIPDLNLSNREAETFADKIEDIISKTAMIDRENNCTSEEEQAEIKLRNDSGNDNDVNGVTERHRQLLIEVGERLDAKPHPLSAQSLRKHMVSCILVDEKQFETLVTAVSGQTMKKEEKTKNEPSDEQQQRNSDHNAIVRNDHHHNSNSNNNNDHFLFSSSPLFDPNSPSLSPSSVIDPFQFGALITRARTSCRIEDQQFEVIIKLGDTPAQSANHIINAANILYFKARTSFEALPLAVADREASLVQCISRVFTMSAIEEKMFWFHVKRRGEFLRDHESRISNIDVHYLPSKSQKQQQEHERAQRDGTQKSNSSLNDIGWCDSQPDGEKVTLNESVLFNAQRFDEWIEDAVAQCTLSRQARLLAQRFSLFYVSRDRSLLLPHYISFLNRYIDSAARNVIEVGSVKNANQQQRHSQTVAMSPIELIVGHHLEMRQDGSLVVPWDFDLSLLVSLLSSPTSSTNEARVLTV